jgi:hypothetical protein
MRAVPAAALVAVLFLSGCSWLEKAPEVRAAALYSPNGEPLSGGPLGQPKCEDAMAGWLAKLDAGHAGSIDAATYLADARRQFAAMDLDRSGVLTPSVLAQYRAPYFAERQRQTPREEDESERDRRRQRERDPPIGTDRTDPVMIADVNLRNRVTLDDFLAYARRNFAALDTNKDGRLDRGEAVAPCKQK